MKKIKYWYNTIHNYITFYLKKREAIIKHRTDGKQYHVVPTSDGKLIVINNDYIKFYNQINKKDKKNHIDINKLLRMAYYSTSSRGVRELPKPTFMEKLLNLFK